MALGLQLMAMGNFRVSKLHMKRRGVQRLPRGQERVSLPFLSNGQASVCISVCLCTDGCVHGIHTSRCCRCAFVCACLGVRMLCADVCVCVHWRHGHPIMMGCASSRVHRGVRIPHNPGGPVYIKDGACFFLTLPHFFVEKKQTSQDEKNKYSFQDSDHKHEVIFCGVKRQRLRSEQGVLNCNDQKR